METVERKLCSELLVGGGRAVASMLQKTQGGSRMGTSSSVLGLLFIVVVAAASVDGAAEPMPRTDTAAAEHEHVCSHYSEGCLHFTFDDELGDFITMNAENESSVKTLLLIEDTFRMFVNGLDGRAKLVPVPYEVLDELVGMPPRTFDFAALAERMPELSAGISHLAGEQQNSEATSLNIDTTVEAEPFSVSPSTDSPEFEDSTLVPEEKIFNSHYYSPPTFEHFLPAETLMSDIEPDFKRIFGKPKSLKPNPDRLEIYAKSYSKDKIPKQSTSRSPPSPTGPVKQYGNIIVGGTFEYEKDTCVPVCRRLGQFLPHLTDCTAYYHCTLDGPVAKKCGAGTAWAPHINTCDHAHVAVNHFCNMHDSCPPGPV